jgi:hypothetical protein
MTKNKITGIGMERLRSNKMRFVRNEFLKLPLEKQSAIKTQAERYFKACKTAGCSIDDDFYKEAILDTRDEAFQEKPCPGCLTGEHYKGRLRHIQE